MKLSVIVPTFRRVAALKRCLRAIYEQRRKADQVIVVRRDTDEESADVIREFVGGWPELETVIVHDKGVVIAMNAGLQSAVGEIVALTDDDAEPWPDWLARIEAHFSGSPNVGGVGGRDWQYKGTPLMLDEGIETRAGELQWWGRIIGQHHWAVPAPPREVVVLKGVNCAYRKCVLQKVGGFDARLAGNGAQVHWELSLGLSVRKEGFRIVFDPAIGVNHYPAERFDEDGRDRFNAIAQRNMVFNETLLLTEHLHGLRRLTFLFWALTVGTRGSPGLFQLVRLILLTNTKHAVLKWCATLSGRLAGMRAAFQK